MSPDVQSVTDSAVNLTDPRSWAAEPLAARSQFLTNLPLQPRGGRQNVTERARSSPSRKKGVALSRLRNMPRNKSCKKSVTGTRLEAFCLPRGLVEIECNETAEISGLHECITVSRKNVSVSKTAGDTGLKNRKGRRRAGYFSRPVGGSSGAARKLCGWQRWASWEGLGCALR